MTDKPKVAIEYCPECKFMLRAGWLAQELLQAFEQELGEVAIRPRSGGDLIVRVGARVL
ncbi:MAG: SelT/selW/selH domain protein, partial [Gammaproteobacteria bacterium]|nr:SelT/selW/selH domain protein [Gammaproteobacteria bacterium]NIR82319.1 SelT/selW/selH domain protein [Gammaproteobacteria bacterium]NIV76457.1 SelT/selW/selH domain protein [Gammaproteobacteria bacterium]